MVPALPGEVARARAEGSAESARVLAGCEAQVPELVLEGHVFAPVVGQEHPIRQACPAIM